MSTRVASEATAEFFTTELSETDPLMRGAIEREEHRQQRQLELLAPKNYTSRATREAFRSIVSFTTIEGYPGKRYHAGMDNLDVIENLARDRAKELFKCRYANVQPHSGTQANQAVFFALLQPGDTVLSMSLDAGGHLSHGLRSNFSGRYFTVVSYGIDPETGLIDYDQLTDLARQHRPKLVITGGSSYPRAVDFARLRAVCDEIGAYLLADIAHFAGLVAAGVHPSPFPHTHVVTSTTNKNLRGPRGGLILTDDPELGRKLDSAIFPGVQGGPLPEFIAARAVAFGEALEPAFTEYAQAVLDNARRLGSVLQQRGYDIVTGGTDTPIVMVDLRRHGLTGDLAERSLENAGIPCNKNLVPGDPQKPSVTSGLRFGTSAVTTRGLRDPELRILAGLVADVLDGLIHQPEHVTKIEAEVRTRVEELASRFPIYQH
ncbi:serine hydroxymethyltransferase [Micromonospora sp. NPDC023956]|uniref:serine hydroxymethyltransferase n=1 Tax=Micromonospora sp. NPDC023956 TaxID=3155722 RepID=UPI0033F1ADCB